MKAHSHVLGKGKGTADLAGIVGSAHLKVVAEPWKMPGFLTSREEEFNLGSEMRLDCSELLNNKVLLKYKEKEKASNIDIRKVQKDFPLTSVGKELYTF